MSDFIMGVDAYCAKTALVTTGIMLVGFVLTMLVNRTNLK